MAEATDAEKIEIIRQILAESMPNWFQNDRRRANSYAEQIQRIAAVTGGQLSTLGDPPLRGTRARWPRTTTGTQGDCARLELQKHVGTQAIAISATPAIDPSQYARSTPTTSEAIVKTMASMTQYDLAYCHVPRGNGE